VRLVLDYQYLYQTYYPKRRMTMNDKKDFSDMFDEDGNEVVVTEKQPLPPTPVGHHIINNNNMQVGAELNLFFKTAGGLKGHLQLHAPTGTEVLEQSAGALAALASMGCVPEHSTAVTPAPTAEVTRQDLPQDGTASHLTCPIHQVPMERKENEHGVWYSHKTEDPAYADKKGWCNGKPRS
jgi:hypothetical protein